MNMKRLLLAAIFAASMALWGGEPQGPKSVMVNSYGVLTAPTNFFTTNATGIATALAPWLGGGGLTNVTLLTHGATNELLPNALKLTAGSNITFTTNGLDLEIDATITGGTGTVTHTNGVLTADAPVLGGGGSDLVSTSASAFRSAIGMEIGVDIQAWDADLADLADGELSGSKVGTGIDAANISTGTLDVARLSSAVTFDNEWDTSAKIAANLGDDKTGSGKIVFDTLPVLTAPYIGNLANMQHNHNAAEAGGILGASALNPMDEYTMGTLHLKYGLYGDGGGVTNYWSVGGDLTVNGTNVVSDYRTNLVSSARSAGVWDFYDDFERDDTAAGTLGVSSSGVTWYWADTSGGGHPGTNAAVRSGRLVSNHKTDEPKIYYAAAQVGAHKAQATRIGAEVIWTDLPGATPAQLSMIIAGQTNSAASWGVHTRFNRSGWALGYIDADTNFVDLASGTYAGGSTLAFNTPYYAEVSIDPLGASASFAGEHVRVESTNFWHFAMNTTADRNWVIWEMYCGDLADMTDLMEIESVWAGGSILPPQITGIVQPAVQLTSLIGTDFAQATLDRQDSTNGLIRLEHTATAYPIGIQIRGTNTSTGGGSINAVRLDYDIQQSGSGGYRLLRLRAKETSTGSGERVMMATGPDQNDPTFYWDILGNLVAGGGLTVSNSATIYGGLTAGGVDVLTAFQSTNTITTRIAGIGAGADGDIIIRDSEGWTNLVADTDGMVLTLASGRPGWAYPATEFTNLTVLDTLTVSNITANGTVSAGSGVFTNGITVGGTGPSWLAGINLHSTASTNIMAGLEIVSGSSTNGTNVSVWSKTVSDNTSLSVDVSYIMGGFSNAVKDVISYGFWRTNGGSAALVSTNHAHVNTNVYMELDGNEAHVYIAAPLGTTANMRGKLEWMSEGNGAESLDLLSNLAFVLNMEDASDGPLTDSHGSGLTFAKIAGTAYYQKPGILASYAVTNAANVVFTNPAPHLAMASGESFTATMWVQPGRIDANSSVLARWDEGAGKRSWHVRRLTAPNNYLLRVTTDGSTSLYVTNSVESAVGEWEFIAVQFDNPNDVIRISGNGSAWQETTVSADLYETTSAAEMSVMANLNSGAAANGIYGAVDQVCYWTNRVLTLSDVQAIYNSGAGRAMP